MAHAVLEHPVPEYESKAHMGMPLSNGKLAIWLFLVTEIMFFTGLIGTYVILRNGAPSPSKYPWPAPHDVHLVEWIGAFNTFVLICSSLTIVLAHWCLHHGDPKKAARYIGVTLVLGCVFLGVKAVEYKAKFDHEILPGRIFEKLDGPMGVKYLRHVDTQLDHILENPVHAGAEISSASAQAWKEYRESVEKIDKTRDDVKKAEPAKSAEAEAEAKKATEEGLTQVIAAHPDLKFLAVCYYLKAGILQTSPKRVNELVAGAEHVKPGDKPDEKDKDPTAGNNPLEGKGIHEVQPELHISYSIPYGNMWASCYFAMTGFHAIHVLGGLVIFVIILVMAARGTFGVRHESMIELTGLYWHFVDIVWIFLFPLLYLV